MFYRYPFVKQEDFKECGVCCLSMMIEYYQGHYSKSELLKLTHTTQKGTSAYHLLEASRKIGFQAKGVKCTTDLSKLQSEDIILPCIAHVLKQTLGHYIVIYKINFRKQELIIADPAESKIKKISFSVFKEMWTGTLLMMYPIENIEFHKETSFREFFVHCILSEKTLFGHILLFSIFITLFSIGISFFMKVMLEFLSKQVSQDTILWVSICFGGLYLLKNVTTFCRNQLLLYVNQKIDLRLLLHTIKHVVHLPYPIYRTKTTGDMLERINDAMKLKNLITQGIIVLFVDFLLFVSSFCILLVIQMKFAILLFLFLAIYGTLSFTFSKLIKQQIWKNKKVESQLQTTLTETILGMESIKGLHLESVQEKRNERQIVSYVTRQFHFEKVLVWKNFLQQNVKDVWYVVFMTLAVFLAWKQEISIGTILFLQSLLTYFLQPIEDWMEMDISLQDANVSLHRLLELFEPEEEEGIYQQLSLQKIEIQKLNYGNSHQECILKDINLTFHRGERIMIMGDSGSGKSTLLKLLMHYVKPHTGNIYYNDTNYKDYTSHSITRNISYLSQNETIFTTTLKQNIVMSRSYHEKNLKKVMACCELEEIIQRHPARIHQLLEENGFNLSGGEKQRIILARYLLHPTAFLFIDEGLSQVDTSMERRILKNIFRYYKDKTFIIVSHRKDNLDLFDRVIEMKQGSIVLDVSKRDAPLIT